MTDIADLYNALPSIEDADEKFIDREATFTKLIPFTSKYNNRYGVCLVHAHAKLEPGEVMISTSDSVTEPVKISELGAFYPERWLVSGQPYEFSNRPIDNPPTPDVFNEFRELVGADSALGLFCVDENGPKTRTETTEGRRSITKPGPPPDGQKALETAWVPGTNIVYSICVICYGC
ncbi:hypothetical protein BYT27DRAFT_7187191 [Phlegmacium glaucopus]|nr:hypothetical protein BYT27DRAFT_7187191 [Phlegmacium glaucopus]